MLAHGFCKRVEDSSAGGPAWMYHYRCYRHYGRLPVQPLWLVPYSIRGRMWLGSINMALTYRDTAWSPGFQSKQHTCLTKLRQCTINASSHLAEARLHGLPVNHLPDGLEVLGLAVLVLEAG